ncbi:MAG TPA: 2Fe-2S iron-sulfur cluster-binding protein [Geothrix sp.]|nr:2Fe-2S iron-sulfur cluster-binding protein [Geothrix sp.]
MNQGIVARTRRGEVHAVGLGTLMDACLAAGLPVASSCFGRGACGKCVMTILAGTECLPGPDEHECLVLARNQAEPCQRLSCQCPMPGGPNQLVVTTGYW